MYLLFPTLLIVFALLVGLVIIARKFTYLKKLTPDAEQHFSVGFFWEFIPELHERYARIDWASYRAFWLRESEKSLRRLRLAFLKIDSLTHRLIKKMHRSQDKLAEQSEASEEEKTVAIIPPTVLPVARLDSEDLKKEEQALIITIAKDPKQAALYRRLAEVYSELDNSADALEALKMAVKLDPEDSASQRKLEELEKKI